MYLAPSSSSRVDARRAGSLSTLSYRSRMVDPLTPTDLDRLADAGRRRNRAEGVSTLMLFDGESVYQWLEGPDEALRRVWASVRCDPRHTSVEVLGRSSTPMRLFGDFELRTSTWKANRGASPSAGSSQASELARLAIALDPDALVVRERALLDGPGSAAASRSGLFESAARRLGDMWQADECTEFEVTLGLGRLQTLLRRGTARTSSRSILDGAPTVLVAPMPGEAHMLCASLDAEAMWRAGWHPHVEFPADPAALCALLAGRWFDALDLSLSMVFQREHWLPRMAQMIRALRAAALNPRLAVVASGRVFSEQPEAAIGVGADDASRSASEIESSVVRALAMPRTGVSHRHA